MSKDDFLPPILVRRCAGRFTEFVIYTAVPFTARAQELTVLFQIWRDCQLESLTVTSECEGVTSEVKGGGGVLPDARGGPWVEPWLVSRLEMGLGQVGCERQPKGGPPGRTAALSSVMNTWYREAVNTGPGGGGEQRAGLLAVERLAREHRTRREAETHLVHIRRGREHRTRRRRRAESRLAGS